MKKHEVPLVMFNHDDIRTVQQELAMTGDLSLVGKVLPVGGIKEKTVAAKLSGVKTLILRLGNKRDFAELEEYLQKDLVVHFADYYEDVYKVAFEQELVHGAIHAKTRTGFAVVYYPAVWKAHTGVLDCDVNLHFNNSSYLYCMELARWHFPASNGILWQTLKHLRVFIAASQAIRYRHSIPPFHAYEIQTQIVHWDGFALSVIASRRNRNDMIRYRNSFRWRKNSSSK
ncbi:hypothetical protein PsorP6_010813 [Peronosclerospora sorghi]|uniref:Uncharacterized protein n=1 Tax=Peronosclerospora sorghi TaxID=230839 RepID=A0ACC0VYB4_9STRA|nr:hypothetical protein PsorP6_010813 [Peronosclerospora sorghi]